MAIRSVKCVLLGNDDVDKRELFFTVVNELKPKKEKHEVEENEKDPNTGEFLRSESPNEDNDNNGAEPVNVKCSPLRFQVLHHTEDNEISESEDDHSGEYDLDSWSGPIIVDNKAYNIEIHECTSQTAYDQLRAELYPDTDVFLVCFSVTLQQSLKDVVNRWVPELRRFCPVTPFLLIGTHINWRLLSEDRAATIDPARRPIFPETGAMYAEKHGAVRYMECATNDATAVKGIFDEVIRVSCMDRMELSQLLPDFVKYGFTLLHQAAQANHEPSIEALAYVMDINTKDRNGRRPLDIAVRRNHTVAARKLILNGAEVKVEIEDWVKRCECWTENKEAEQLVHRNVNELARRVLNLYAGWSTPADASILLIGQHGIEIGKFLRESIPFIPIKSLAIVNTDGPCAFVFTMTHSLTCLTLTNCDIMDVPLSIYELTNLNSLSLVSCNIGVLRKEISDLKQLQKLRLTDNKLRRLPDTIGRLHNLRFLHCDYNVLESLPDQMGSLTELEVLELTHNKLEKLSASLGLLNKLKCLKFAKNRLRFPPEEVLRKGNDEVLEFLNKYLDDPVLNKQVKVTIVGGEGAGKTTLVKALGFKYNWKLSTVMDSEERTKGLEISNIDLNESLRMKVFDLGGDSFYFDIHALFLSENSLYQAVFDMATYVKTPYSNAFYQLGTLEVWLQVIHSQAPNSHVVIVATNAGHPNLTDALRSQIREDIEKMLAKYRKGHKSNFASEAVPQCALCDETHLCDVSSAQFYIRGQPGEASGTLLSPDPSIPHIVGYYEVSCKEVYPKVFLSSKNLGLQKLKCGLALKMEVLLSSNVGSRIPQKCLYFRDRVLEISQTEPELQEQPIMTLTRLRDIALGCGMRDDHKLKAMISYFHTQGDFLWYEDVPELADVVFVRPQWLADQLRTIYPPYRGHHALAHGILRTDNLMKLWPDFTATESELLHSLLRKLGLCFKISEGVDLFPSLFPLGHPDKESWPLMPPPDHHQLTVEYAFSFLPPTFFSDLIVVLNKREVVSLELCEPSYYRLHVVFGTYLKASEGCILHNHENVLNSPLEELDPDSEGSHLVHIECVPHSQTLRASVRGAMPCCVLPELVAAIKSVTDVRYPGIKFNELLVCPVCELTKETTAKKPEYLHEPWKALNLCSNGHECGSRTEILSGKVPGTLIGKPATCSPSPPPGEDFLEYHFCPKLFIVLPVGFQSVALKDLHVMSHVTDGYAVHLLCECPGYWHLVPDPGYRIRRPDEFFARFGERACRLLKVIFLMGEEDSLTYPSLKNFLLKIVVGDPALRETLASDLKNLLEHYYELFPEIVEGCSSVRMDEDLEYLVCGKDLKRSKLAQMLELSAEGRVFGPLVCTYVERHKENMWLCRKHAYPVHQAASGTLPR